jgi:hypothetical protein
MARLVPIVIGCLAAALAVSAALAATPPDTTVSAADTRPKKNLWATVNVCDTAKNPDRLGIRARAFGIGRESEKIWMRFFAEYMKDGRWVRVDGARSKWIRVGRADYTWQETGFTFNMGPLNPVQSFRMRGLVKFQWRRSGEVVRATRVRTSSGHVRKAFGDPKGYSAATCFMSGSS